jgi:hypothetical protein
MPFGDIRLFMSVEANEVRQRRDKRGQSNFRCAAIRSVMVRIESELRSSVRLTRRLARDTGEQR